VSEQEPTLREVLWRLNEVAKQLSQLAQDMRQDRIDAANTYVRKDVYAPDHAWITSRVKDVETVIDDRDKVADATRRQIAVGIIIALLAAVPALVLAINNFLAAGGQTP
jgi:hypothetical protein